MKRMLERLPELFREPTAEEVAAREDLEKRQRVLDLSQRGIPEKDVARVLGIEPLEARTALLSARAFLSYPPSRRILVLSGMGGEGKTTAAAWWAAQGAYSRFAPAPEIARMEYSPERTSYMHALETVLRLVVDDLGSEALDREGRVLAAVDALINARYAGMRKTLITTNLTRDGFRERYGVRIWRRIEEVGGFVELARFLQS